MTVDVVATVLTGIAVVFGVLFGVWKMLAAYETRNDAAHAALTARIDAADAASTARSDKLYELLLERLPKAS